MIESHLQFRLPEPRHIHLGISGSVAAFKILEIVRRWQELDASVSVCLTAAAREFITPLSCQALGATPVHLDQFDPAGLAADTFAHLYPNRHAHAFVIAPATADILARVAQGRANDMLACQALAYPRPIMFAPAMNPAMWAAAPTQANCATLRQRGHILLDPESGEVACGQQGQGKLTSLEIIHAHVWRLLCPQDLTGHTVLVTLGPTREPMDGVRFLSNPSSGRMGASMAMAAWLRGAKVTVVRGPCDVWLPEEIQQIRVTTASDMLTACEDIWPSCDIAILVAAVCDFAFSDPSATKLKKHTLGDHLDLCLESTPDILSALVTSRTLRQRVVGFAAETNDLVAYAREKLQRKQVDLLVANQVGQPGSGFESQTNTVHLLSRQGLDVAWPSLPKTTIAWNIWDILAHE